MYTAVIALANGTDVLVKSAELLAVYNLLKVAELNQGHSVTISENRVTEVYSGNTRLEGVTFAPGFVENVFITQ